jgi:hypothetical protein
MTTFRGVVPLSPSDTRYALGYRYAVATAEVSIGGGTVTAVNAALGGAVVANVTFTSVVYSVARTLADGDAESLVIGSASPGTTESATFEAVSRGRTDGFRVVTFADSLTPTGAPGALSFHFVHYGLVGNVFVVGESEEIDDGPLTGPGGLQARYYSGRDFIGLPVQEPVENVDLQRSETISGINMENFSARWVGYIRPPATGNYRFRYTSDGRGRVVIGDQTYIDGWGGNSRRVQVGPVKALVLNEDIFIRVEVENTTLGHEAVLEWETPSTPGTFVVVPASVMFYGVQVTITPERQAGASHYVQTVNRYLEA